ncbi:8906_t:CDS:2 [Funneliformis caledonium]|uniref:8906_t:CDS:1 n=1 Tax=Funneliformis caledonium TaxID=1117310 RepID=A0A9N9N7L8_9GLOM|nr:8906_t:CDS:2 [Funneliformis caledonium]
MSTSTLSFETVNNWTVENVKNYLENNKDLFSLNDVEISKIEKEGYNGRAFLLVTKEDLLQMKLRRAPATNIAEFVTQLNSQKLLDSDIYASSILPVIDYPPDASTTLHSANSGGLWPSRITRWNEFFYEATRFDLNQSNICQMLKLEKPQFINGLSARVEKSIETALEVNIFRILNQFLLPKFEFLKQKDSYFNHDDPNIGTGLPDFTCRKYKDSDDSEGRRIIEIKVKRDIVVKQLYETNLDELFSYEGSGDSSGLGISGQNYTAETQERTYGYKEIKIEGILESGQTGRTFKAIICGEPVAMKAIDLFKEADLLRKVKKEINIYQILMEIQGKIDRNQRNRALEALRAIHSYGILHNDIRQENILVNEKGKIYIIDFGISIITNDRRQFYDKESELSNLLDRYMF